MKDKLVNDCIYNELSKLEFILHSGNLGEVTNEIEKRIDEKDSELVISKKIYDVLFFFFSGSHLEKNPINIKDYGLLARRIKLAIDKPEGIIGELLVKINEIQSIIVAKQKELSDLHKKESELTTRVQSICGHLDFIQEQLYYEDEYGTTHTGNMMRKCKICGFKEEAKSNRPWTDYGGEYEFKKILGPEPSRAKIKLKK